MDEAKRLQHTAAQIDEGLDLAFAAAPQSSTYTKNQVDDALANKVNKVAGMGLSTNDFSNLMKTKLIGIESGAEVNVQADWNQSDYSADDYIKNKPTIPAAPVNADWNASSGLAKILNKPTLGTAAAANTTTTLTQGGTGLPTAGTVYAKNLLQDTEIGSLVDKGAKNIYHVTAISSTNNNVTFTVYLDGTVGIKTTAAGASQSTFFFLSSYMTIQPGTYMLSGGISNSVMLYDGTDTNPWKSTGEATEKTFNAATNLRLCIRVNSGYTNTTEVIVKPMICTKADYDISNTYVPYALTNRELYIGQSSYTAESANGSFPSLLHNAASYCGVDDTQEVNGFVVFTSSVTSENLIGFFNFKYLRNAVFSPVISNTITYSAQSQYGTITVTGGTGPYKAVVKFL